MSSTGNNLKLNGNIHGLSAKQTAQIHHHHQQQQQHHHHQLQNQHHQPPPSSSSSLSQPTTSSVSSQQLHHQLQPAQISQHSATSAAVHQQISSGLHHLPNNNTNNIASSTHQSSNGGVLAHTIPPRYQPPPLPPGGILKHIPNPKASSGFFNADVGGGTGHISIKYPPEIPKLASVFIPESIKSGSAAARFSQRPPPHRLSAGQIQIHHDDHIVRTQQTQSQSQPQQQQQQQQQHQDMLKFVRKPDPDPGATSSAGATASITGPGRLSVEQNRHLQSLLAELRALKEANQRLSDDNQELRDLCCFLDDDRQKGRKLAREWQRFGRYTASVMRQEVSAYQNKLRQLDDKQQELIRDNLELKELCLYLDEERAHVAANTLCASCGAATRPTLRDDGDGSSSSTNADETISNLRQFDRQIPVSKKPLDLNIRSTLSDQTLHYVRSLERRIRQLEEERLAAAATVQQTVVPDPISGRPEAVVRALQVLEVREQLERDRLGGSNAVTASTPEQMDDGEKALVREMCNVVWRKLEDSPNGPSMDPL